MKYRRWFFVYPRPATSRTGDGNGGLYGYLVVHVVDAGTIRRRSSRPLRSRIARCRHHLHWIGHLQRSHERHRPSSSVHRRRRRRCRHGGFSFNLRWLMRRKYRHTASRCRMISCPRWIAVRLLGRARRIRAVVIIRRWRTLTNVRMWRHADRARWRWITARRIVLPHVDTTLRRAGKFPDIVNGIVRARVRMLVALAYELALRQKTSLRTVSRHDTRYRSSADTDVVVMLHVVVRRRFGDTYKVGPTNLRRCTWIGSATETHDVSNDDLRSRKKWNQNDRPKQNSLSVFDNARYSEPIYRYVYEYLYINIYVYICECWALVAIQIRHWRDIQERAARHSC